MAGIRIHVHRRVDRMELRSSLNRPVCDDGPCPPPPRNDQDGIDEDYRYDEQNRLIESVERFTRYDHQGGTWRDAPAVPTRAAGQSAESEAASICDIDPTVCRRRVLVGGTFRPFYVRTRTVELRYRHGTDALPTFAHFSVLERWKVDEKGSWQELRPVDDQTTEYAYEIEPRVVTRYLVRDGVRVPDRRVERDGGGRAFHETRFSDGDIWYEVSHRDDDAGRRVEMIRTDRAHRSQGSTERMVTAYAYDPLGRLTEVRTTRPSDGWTLASTYEYGAGCSSIPRVFEQPPGVLDSIDPVEEVLDRFVARP